MRKDRKNKKLDPMETLAEAVKRTAKSRWVSQRTYNSTLSQVYTAIEDLQQQVLNRLPPREVEARWAMLPQPHQQTSEASLEVIRRAQVGKLVRMGEVTSDDIEGIVDYWEGEANRSPATIEKRLGCLSALGLDVAGQYPSKPRKLKWWLRPDDQARLTEWLRSTPDLPFCLVPNTMMANFIDWTIFTGLRVEETLKLTWADVEAHPELPLDKNGNPALSIAVSGMKTSFAQATLPISEAAVALLVALRKPGTLPSHHVFPVGYLPLRRAWERCRKFLGVEDVDGATLKSLRRRSARYLHSVKGMPLDQVRHYLRHESIKTTMGYLQLTGGYGVEEMRRWL